MEAFCMNAVRIEKGAMVLVTGADGFLGSNLVRALLESGYRVRAMLQPGRDTGTLDSLPIEEIRFDLVEESRDTNSAVWKTALSGVDAVIHTVASTAVWPSRNPGIWGLNVDAAVSLALVARSLGVRRFVHVGTANSFACSKLARSGRIADVNSLPGKSTISLGSDPNHAGSDPDVDGTEDAPYTAGVYGLDYQDSKRVAQEKLLALADDRFQLVIGNPTFMFGPFDSKPGSGELIIGILKGKVPGIAPGGRCFANVTDVAAGLVAAMERGRSGTCYILGGENLTYAELYGRIAAVAGPGCRVPKFRLPAPAVLATGAAGSALAAMTGKAPKISLAMARIACECQFYRSARAQAELGYRIHPIDEGIRAAIEWFRARGML
jgi:dihydroflavonol-4-reductase